MVAKWKIRLLGGVLNGREILLPSGVLSLGEKDCDVLIPLQQNIRLVFETKNEALFASAKGGVIRVNGRRYRSDQALPDSGIISVAGMRVVFGPSEMNLAGYVVPRSVWRIYLLPTGLLIVVLGLLVSLWVVLLPSAQQIPINEQVNNLLTHNGLTQIKVLWLQDGSVTLSGSCQHITQMQAVRHQLEGLGVFYHDQVICDDQLVQDVSDILFDAGYDNIKVTVEAPGSILIQGDISLGQRWSQTQPLLSEIAGLHHWRIENPLQTQGKAVIGAILHSPLADKVSVTNIGESFVISAVLSQPDKHTLQQIMANLRTQYPQLQLDYQEVPPSVEIQKQLPSPIAGIVNGKHGIYLALENGQRLVVGSRLDNGSQVVVLTTQSLGLLKDNSLINYPFHF